MRTVEKYSTYLLLLVVLLALLIRIWGIGFDLPYLSHPDEPNKVEMAQRMFKTGDLSPHYFLKPTLFIYLNALLYIPFYIIGKYTAGFESVNDVAAPMMTGLGTGWTPMPGTFLMGRSLTAAFAILGVILVYLVGKVYFTRSSAGLNSSPQNSAASNIAGMNSVGLLAAFLLALSPIHVASSRYITVNVFLSTSVLAVVLVAHNIMVHGRRRDYIMSGLLVGITTSFKYPGIVVAAVIVAAHFLRPGRQKLWDKYLIIAMLMIPIGFFIGTPFALLDFKTFLAQALSEVRHYSSGHSGMEGNALLFYLRTALLREGVMAILAGIEIFRSYRQRDKSAILLSVFPITYFLFISIFAVRNERTYLPIIPFTCLFASAFLVSLYRWSQLSSERRRYVVTTAVIAIVLVFSVAMSSVYIRNDTNKLIAINGRDVAREWINANIPAGTKIASESYAPFLSPAEYELVNVVEMTNYDLSWYQEQGVEYLVFSQGMYGRYYKRPERYANQIQAYEDLQSQIDHVVTFDDGGYEVKIYKLEGSD